MRNDFRMLHYSFLHHKILSNRLFVNQSRQVCGKISDSPKKGFLGFDQNGKNAYKTLKIVMMKSIIDIFSCNSRKTIPKSNPIINAKIAVIGKFAKEIKNKLIRSDFLVLLLWHFFCFVFICILLSLCSNFVRR